MSPRSIVVFCLWLFVALGTAAAQTSPFKLEPAVPKVGEPFQVVFAEAADAPAGVKYDWFVNARESGAAVDPTAAGIPEMAPSEPQLTIAKARANTSYRIVLVRMAGETEQVLPALSLRFDALQLVAEPAAAPAPMPGAQPAPAAGATPASAVPLPPDPSPNESVNQKLLSARIWADGIATAPKSADLVLPVEYFQLALSKPRQ